MWNINRITLPKRNQWNKKEFKISFINGNHGVYLKTISIDFAVLFSDRLFIESEDEKHNEAGRWKSEDRRNFGLLNSNFILKFNF